MAFLLKKHSYYCFLSDLSILIEKKEEKKGKKLMERQPQARAQRCSVLLRRVARLTDGPKTDNSLTSTRAVGVWGAIYQLGVIKAPHTLCKLFNYVQS